MRIGPGGRHMEPVFFFLPGQGQGDRRPTRPCRLAYGGGTLAARGLPHLARICPCPSKGQPLSVRRSIVRRREGGRARPRPGQHMRMHACTHIVARRKQYEENHTNPSLSPSCPSLDMTVSLSSALTYFFIVLSWKPAQVTHLSPFPSSLLTVTVCILSSLRSPISHIQLPLHPAYLLFCPPTKARTSLLDCLLLASYPPSRSSEPDPSKYRCTSCPSLLLQSPWCLSSCQHLHAPNKLCASCAPRHTGLG